MGLKELFEKLLEGEIISPRGYVASHIRPKLVISILGAGVELSQRKKSWWGGWGVREAD